ncbi:hypothetical protein FJY93_03325 [Candidatus Kaiserbacteria bacterium]|nr:hypothetical protein [Candidatus Kaiserbacteria bacterium]
MSLLDRIWKRGDVDSEFSYGDEIDAVETESRIPGFVKTWRFWLGLVAAFVVLSVVFLLRFGFIPTEIEKPRLYPKAPVGTTLTRAVQNDIESELDHGAIAWGWIMNGWVPDDFWPWPRMVLAYRDEFQRGKYLIWKLTVRSMLQDLSQQGRRAFPDANLEKADAKIGYDIDLVFAYPSVVSNMSTAVDALGAYADELKIKRNFYPQAETLGRLLQQLHYGLNLSITELTNKDQIGFMQGYQVFQRTQGRIHAILRVLQAVETDFGEVLDSKALSRQQLHDTIDSLTAGLNMSPLVICNGEAKWWAFGLPCFGYTHIANLLQNINPGERELSRLIETVRGASSR